MFYNDFIKNIINTRGQWNIPKGILYENHHIIPRCMGGLPEHWTHTTKHENLIWLTLEEHLEAHRLLAEENQNISFKRTYYFMKLINGIIVSDEEAVIAREEFIKSISGENSPSWGVKRPRMHYNVGENNPMYGIGGFLGKHHSDESKAKISITSSGENNGMYGKGYLLEGHRNGHAKPVKCIELNKDYLCVKYAAEDLNLKATDVAKSANKGIATKNGFHFEFIPKNN